MKKFYLLLLFLIIICCSEQTKKSYDDYNHNDFVEVQGIIIKSKRKTNFQNIPKTDIHFIYNLDKDKPLKGYELESPFMVGEGEPVVILVHKDNEKVSFFGSRGIIQEKVLLEYLEKCERAGGGYYGIDSY